MSDGADPLLKVMTSAPQKGSLNNFVLTPGKPGPGSVEIKVQGLAGNNPKANGNTIALFSGVGPNPAQTPLKVFELEAESSNTFKAILDYDFQPEDYSLTYQVSGASTTKAPRDLSTMCATAFLYEFQMPASEPITHVSMQIEEARASDLLIRYNVLPNYQPAKFQNWIGLWEGSPNANAPLPDPTKAVSLMSDMNVGMVQMKGLTLFKNFPYTLIYFMAPKSTGFATGDTKAGAVIYFSLSAA